MTGGCAEDCGFYPDCLRTCEQVAEHDDHLCAAISHPALKLFAITCQNRAVALVAAVSGEAATEMVALATELETATRVLELSHDDMLRIKIDDGTSALTIFQSVRAPRIIASSSD